MPIPKSGLRKGWFEMGSRRMGVQVFVFHQQDINEGRIYYKHGGESYKTDNFIFEVCIIHSPY